MRARLVAFLIALVARPAAAVWTETQAAPMADQVVTTVYTQTFTTTLGQLTGLDITTCTQPLLVSFDASTGDSSSNARLIFDACPAINSERDDCRQLRIGSDQAILHEYTDYQLDVAATALVPVATAATVGGDTAQVQVKCARSVQQAVGAGLVVPDCDVITVPVGVECTDENENNTKYVCPTTAGPCVNGTGLELVTTGATAAAAGSNSQVQYNNANTFGANSCLTFDVATGTLTACSFDSPPGVDGQNFADFDNNPTVNPGAPVTNIGRVGFFEGLFCAWFPITFPGVDDVCRHVRLENTPRDQDGDGDPDYIYVSDYDGDGTLESYEDVAAAVESLTDSGPKLVHVGPGTFAGPSSCTGACATAVGNRGLVRLGSDTRLVGSGIGITVLQGIANNAYAASFAIVTNSGHTGQTIDSAQSNIELADLTLDGNEADSYDISGWSSPYRYGVWFVGCTDCVVHRTEARDLPAEGINYSKPTRGLIEDTRLWQTGGYGDPTPSPNIWQPGIRIYTTNGFDAVGPVVRNNRILKSGGSPLYASRDDVDADLVGTQLVGNYAQEVAGTQAISGLIGTTDTVFAGNVLKQAGGLLIGGDTDWRDGATRGKNANVGISVRDNVFIDSTVNGSAVLYFGDYNERMIATGNQVLGSGAGTDCVYFEPPWRNSFIDVFASQCGNYGSRWAPPPSNSGATPRERAHVRITIDGTSWLSRTQGATYAAMTFHGDHRNLDLDITCRNTKGQCLNVNDGISGDVIRDSVVRIDADMTEPMYLGDFTFAGRPTCGTPLQSGTATGGSTTTIVQTGAGWTVNAYAGKYVRVEDVSSATGAGATVLVTSNTADTLTVPSVGFTVASGDTFTIYTGAAFTMPNDSFVSLSDANGTCSAGGGGPQLCKCVDGLLDLFVPGTDPAIDLEDNDVNPNIDGLTISGRIGNCNSCPAIFVTEDKARVRLQDLYVYDNTLATTTPTTYVLSASSGTANDIAGLLVQEVIGHNLNSTALFNNVAWTEYDARSRVATTTAPSGDCTPGMEAIDLDATAADAVRFMCNGDASSPPGTWEPDN